MKLDMEELSGDSFGTSDTDEELGNEAAVSSPAKPLKRRKAKAIIGSLKSKIQELPDIVLSKADQQTPDTHEELHLSEDPAFDPALVLSRHSPKKQRNSDGDIASKVKAVGNAVAHPRQAIRNKAAKVTAGKISESQQPYLTAEQDLELLEAHEHASKAASIASGSEDSEWEGDLSPEVAHERLRNIEENRANIKSAWAIGRHSMRVRAVNMPVQRPRRADFMTPTSENQAERLEWEKWLAKLMLWHCRGFTVQYIDDFDHPPFDIQDLARIVERLAVVSAPWQAFFVDVRHLYAWQDPRRTAKWAALFWTLFYTEHIVGFFYCYVIYMTIRNRFYPSSIESIRESMQRSHHREASAKAWGELIEKHGKTEWVEPLLEQIGPIIQMQLGDLANFIEVLTNFYRWERPNKTAGTLFFFTVCLAITLLADMRFCMKIIWFIVGSSFFFTSPIAVRFPRYRIVVDALRWIFWDIPTHAELGIIQLQQKTILEDAKHQQMVSKYDESDPASDSEYLTASDSPARGLRDDPKGRVLRFRAYVGKTRGLLTLTRECITFEGGDEDHRILLSTLIEMRKVNVPSKTERMLSFQSKTKALEFEYQHYGSTSKTVLSIIVRKNDRHKIFAHVLAWSNLKWQFLQLDRHGSIKNPQRQIEQTLGEAMD